MSVIVTQPKAVGSNGNLPTVPTVQQGFPGNNRSAPAQLRHLATADRVIIKQKIEALEIVLGCETENKYDILDDQNQVIYTVEETSEFCMRCLCGPLRPIVVSIMDTDGNIVMMLERPLACQDFCFPCCLQKMTIASPPERSIGRIVQKWNIRPELHILNENNETDFIVKGPLCQFSCKCGDVDFPIFASDGVSECGKISKKWRGVLHEFFTNADIFGVKFPPGITPLMKALLIAATFLVDYMYFEETHQHRH